MDKGEMNVRVKCVSVSVSSELLFFYILIPFHFTYPRIALEYMEPKSFHVSSHTPFELYHLQPTIHKSH